MGDVAARLAEGRAAYLRRDWAVAYDALSEVRREAGLEADDLDALADACWWRGLIQEALGASEESHERYLSEGRLDQAAMVALGAGFNWMLRGELDIGMGWLSRGRRLLENLPLCTAHGFLLWVDATARAEQGDLEGALEDCARIAEIGRELAEPMLQSGALALQGTIRLKAGEPARGFELLDEAMLPVLAGRVPPEYAGNLYCQMMSLCHDLADVPRARRWTRITERWCDTFTSAVMFVGICRVHRSQLLRLSGDWDAAEREAAVANAELAELNVEAVGEARYELGETHRLRGDLVGADRWYAAAAQLGRSPEPGASLLLALRGRTDDALSALGRALLEQPDPLRRVRLLAAQAEVACDAGRSVLAETATTELTALAGTYGSPGFRAWAAQAQGALALCSGDHAGAVAPLRDALARYESMGASYDAATCRALLGRACGGLGDLAGAEAEWLSAHEVFTRLGAAPRLAWMGAAPTQVTATSPGGLTEREVQILGLVAGGLSNRDVARRLVISEKTVARHLANVYAKLDVGSRTAASAWAHQNGLVRS